MNRQLDYASGRYRIRQGLIAKVRSVGGWAMTGFICGAISAAGTGLICVLLLTRGTRPLIVLDFLCAPITFVFVWWVGGIGICAALVGTTVKGNIHAKRSLMFSCAIVTLGTLTIFWLKRGHSIGWWM